MTNEEKVEEWTKLYYGSLVDCTCTGVSAKVDEYGDCWPTLVFEHPEKGKLEIEISCDEEGNRPGFLFGLPIVPDKLNPYID